MPFLSSQRIWAHFLSQACQQRYPVIPLAHLFSNPLSPHFLLPRRIRLSAERGEAGGLSGRLGYFLPFEIPIALLLHHSAISGRNLSFSDSLRVRPSQKVSLPFHPDIA